jgi:hypothetical protein
MKNRNISQKRIFLILSACLISGCQYNSHPPLNITNMPILSLFKQNAVLASAVNFDTKKLIVLDPNTGKGIAPCKKKVENDKFANHSSQTKPTGESDMKNIIQNCETNPVIDNPNSLLNAALKSSQEPIQGEIEKNGKIIPAQFVVTVKALYKGSNCETDFSGGNQVEHCIPDGDIPGLE